MSALNNQSELTMARNELAKALSEHLPVEDELDIAFTDDQEAKIPDGRIGIFIVWFTGGSPTQPQVLAPVRYAMDCNVSCQARDEEQANRMRDRVHNLLRDWYPSRSHISPWSCEPFHDKRSQVYVNRVTIPMKIVA